MSEILAAVTFPCIFIPGRRAWLDGDLRSCFLFCQTWEAVLHEFVSGLHLQSVNANVFNRRKSKIFSTFKVQGKLFTKSEHFLIERSNYVTKIIFTSF